MSLKEIDFTDSEISNMYKLVGVNVKRVRQNKSITQLELGLAIGHTGAGTISVAEICHNEKHFNLEHLYKISKVLEVDMCEFFKPLDNSDLTPAQ